MEEIPSTSNAAIPPSWEDIERSESYLVCCIYEEAASLSHSVLKRLCEINSKNNKPYYEIVESGDELDDMFESAGMVYVQSLNQLGRTLEILKELKLLFGSVTAIPVQVFLTGACLQIPGGISSDFQEILEEFLSKWKYMDGNYYSSVSVGNDVTYVEGFSKQFVLGVDKYLEIVELYVITFLGRIMRNVDLAVSWVEKASLPEEKRQHLLRQLHSMNTSKLSSSLEPATASLLQMDEYGTKSASIKEEETFSGSANNFSAENNTKQALKKMYKNRVPFWWFRTITLKFGNTRFVVSNGNIFLCCLALLLFFIVRRKSNLRSIIRKQASSVKKALSDLWELAFSYQVNPLAAVQSLPTAR
nr:protein APEM9 [Ipomoea batatas]